MAYKEHIFYKVSDFSLLEKSEIIHYAKLKTTDWWVDKLDCAESWARQKVEMSFNEIMKKFTNTCHFTIIHRRGNEESKHKDLWKWQGEIGFSTMGQGVEHFLWINISEEDLEKLVEKFELVIHR